MKNPEELIATVQAVELGNYDISSWELNVVRNFTKGDLFGAMCLMYKYGFLRGQRSEKNRSRKIGADSNKNTALRAVTPRAEK